MFKLYREKDVKKLVVRLKAEYDEVLRSQRAAAEEIKAENRALRARISVLEGERGNVSEALLAAVREGERVKEESAAISENERKELLLLAEKCRLLAAKLTEKYPDAEDVEDFRAFTEALHKELGEEEESGFNMDDVLAPKQPLDLEKLCKDLGLMEDDV